MNLKSIGANQTETKTDSGVIVFYSYQTPVAVFDPGRGALCSTEKYSKTTSRHVTQAVERWGATQTNVAQAVINEYANK